MELKIKLLWKKFFFKAQITQCLISHSTKALVNAFQKERVPERVPESEERSRNAFLIFKKERDRNAITKIKRNAKGTRAFLTRSFFSTFLL